MIFSMVTVEFTLNYNMLLQVLGWRGRFWFPNQLIPTVIGVCGLFRVLYVGFQQWRSPRDAEPSLDKDVPINPSQAVPKPHGKSAFRLFAARTLVDARNVCTSQYQHDDNEMDPLLEGQSAWLRYLVSYLPWLVLVRWWHLEDEDYEWNLYQHPNLQVKPRQRKGGPHGNTLRGDPKHGSWGSGMTTVNSPRSAHFAHNGGCSKQRDNRSASCPNQGQREGHTEDI